MLHEGVELKTVSEILFHISISITADIYSHVIEEKKKQAAKKLDKYIKLFHLFSCDIFVT